MSPTQSLTYTDELKRFEQEAADLIPRDDDSCQRAELFIVGCKGAAQRNEDERKELVAPHTKEADRLNGIYKPVTEAFLKLARMMDDRLGAYRAEIKRIEQEKQRRAIEEANRIKREEEEKAAAARRAAEEARARGDEKAAEKLETKADKAEMKAATTAPEILPTQTQKTRELADGSKITERDVKDWLYTSGAPKGGKYTRNDPRLKDLPDDLFVIDEGAIGKRIRAGATIPGITVTTRTTSSVRT